MDSKIKALQSDIDSLNPRQRITQAILPRLERTKERYSVEPDVYTRSGRRVLKKPTHHSNHLDDLYSSSKREIIITSGDNSNLKLKPIIHTTRDASPRSGRKYNVNFND